MIKKHDLLAALNKIAPESEAERWDNGGIQVFTGKEEISTIMTCLDVTKEVILEAKEKGVDWIVSHHPLFFHEIKSLDRVNPVGEIVMMLIENGISLYSAHTSFDGVKGGNNDYLAKVLEIEEIEREEHQNRLLFIGRHQNKSLTVNILCELIQEKLSIQENIRYVGDGDAIATKIAICTGAGSDFWKEAKDMGCEVLITGDVKYHDAMLASQMNINLIDAGHFYTEKLFALNMQKHLMGVFNQDVMVIASKTNINPIKIF